MPDNDEELEEHEPSTELVSQGDEYSKLKEEAPPRDVELPGTNGHKSLEESENDNAELSDTKASLKRLFPHCDVAIIDRVLQSAMIARTAPDVFLDMIYLTVTSVVEDLDADGLSFDVQEIINLVYAAFSIGLEGKGRIDILELAGSAKEQEQLEKLSKSMGFA